MIKYSHRLPFNIEIVTDTIVRKHARSADPFALEGMRRFIVALMHNPHPMIVPVYDFTIGNRVGGWIEYSYDMQRLGVLNSTEKNMIEDAGYNRRITAIDLKTRQRYPELTDFLNQILVEDSYWDLHDGNIMKNEQEEYKLIDLEGFNLEYRAAYGT
jgi:hypothetical protein